MRLPSAESNRCVARRIAAIAVALLAIASPSRSAVAQATPSDTAPVASRVVHVIPIEGMIDMGLAPFVERILRDAAANDAAAVVLEINTFGGRVDAAVAIRDALLSSDVLTIAYVNRRAISAGALIALAANHIVMADGSTIGAATPVQMGPTGTSEPTAVDEKGVSYVRGEFRATATARGRPATVAEAMVDADIVIPGLIEKGKLLTLTTDEALEHGIADFQVRDINDALSRFGLTGAELQRTSPNWAEGFVRLITHPLLASLLLSVAMLGILLEIRTPGFGIPGALGVTALILVMGGHWVVQLVGWEEIILVGLGMILLSLELFVIPGFGIAGIAGILSLLAGLSLALVGQGATIGAMLGALGRVGMSMVVAIAASLLMMRYLPSTPMGRQLMLDTALPRGGGDDAEPEPNAPSPWLRRVGRTTSPLRPAGIAEFDGKRVDVVSEGDLIESGTAVVVTRVDGNRIVVRRQSA
ncbi:MAG TPA: NfeD family protein [Gemmatimonadaceae bacterium]|nr:NfeD family protein [Gemmatimonadaceae bacterium]